jgi:hypothetical protein
LVSIFLVMASMAPVLPVVAKIAFDLMTRKGEGLSSVASAVLGMGRI